MIKKIKLIAFLSISLAGCGGSGSGSDESTPIFIPGETLYAVSKMDGECATDTYKCGIMLYSEQDSGSWSQAYFYDANDGAISTDPDDLVELTPIVWDGLSSEPEPDYAKRLRIDTNALNIAVPETNRHICITFDRTEMKVTGLYEGERGENLCVPKNDDNLIGVITY